MSTRKERAERAREWLTCRGCGVYRAGPHFDPSTKTYICAEGPSQEDYEVVKADAEQAAIRMEGPRVALETFLDLTGAPEIGSVETLDSTSEIQED